MGINTGVILLPMGLLLLSAPLSAASARADRYPVIGLWQCAGPFKDVRFGSLVTSFKYVFAPEEEILSSGGRRVHPQASYRSPFSPSGALCAWTEHPEWVDGYRHLLPKGPPPARNETFYLYRVITVKDEMSLTLRIYAEDAIGVWLNGETIGTAFRNYGPHHYPVPLVTPVRFQPGENHVLVKITSIFGPHGFAFALDGVTPSTTQVPLAWSDDIINDSTRSNFHGGDRPVFSEDSSAARDGACDQERLVKRLRGMQFDVTMLPMFDPPESAMEDRRDSLTPTPGAAAYLKALTALRPTVETALNAWDNRAPDAASVVAAANAAVEAFWVREVKGLSPIAFIRCPAFGVNAIAPYSSGGSSPSSICVWNPGTPDRPAAVLFTEPGLAIYDMNLSYDAGTLFFSAKRRGVAGGWHIYSVGIDGTGLKQITEGAQDDISPLLLPDGRLMFVSTRANTWVQCQGQKAGLLYTCERDGSGVRKVSANIDSDHSPQIMNDGRVLFTRWDYGIEKNVFARHQLWTMRPDGSEFRLFHGNTIEDPAGFWEARQVPGRPEVVCTLGPHHSFHAGMAGIVWNQLGPEAPRGTGFRFVTREIPVYCDTTFAHGYQDLFPVNERLFLVSYGGDGAKKNRLYLLDDRGNRKCIYEGADNLGCWSPMLVQSRPLPPVIPSASTNPEWVYRDPEEMNANPDAQTGTLFVQDVYTGLAPQIRRGEARYLQVIEQVQKSRRMSDGEAWGHTPIISRGTVHVRREIGLVPVEPDGSARFTVPALRSISFNLLDADGKTLMRMGSDLHVMPGEEQSCVGCHEVRQGPQPPQTKPALALAKPAVTPVPPEWGNNGIIDYQLVVQPVLDRYCVSCHGGPRPDAYLDLSGDRTRFFCVSYDNLVERGFVDYHQPFAGDHDETAPKSVGAVVSSICRLIDTSEHCKKTMSWDERRRIYAWIDANVPYYGTYDYRRVSNGRGGEESRGIGARDSWRVDPGERNSAGWAKRGVWATFEKRCLACHKREVYNGGFWGFGGGTMNRTMTVTSDLWTDRSLNAHMFAQRYNMSALIGPELRINLTRPLNSSILQAPLSRQVGGWGLCKTPDRQPVFADRNDSDYKRMRAAIETGKANLYANPRVDMSPEHVGAIVPTVLPPGAWFNVAPVYSNLTPLSSIADDAINLAQGGSASSPDGIDLETDPRDADEKAIDGDMRTYWDERDNRGPYRLVVSLPVKQTISAVRLYGWNHHDFAPRDFSILCDGREIGRVADAVYRDNCLMLSFVPVACQSVELNITGQYGGSPAIREFQIYNLAASE